MPPLAWRAPAFVWTPVALVLAIGWPWMLLQGDGALADFALIAGAVTFAIGLTSLGASWIAKRPPRTRRTVMTHFIWAGAAISLAAPFVFSSVLQTVAAYREAEQSVSFETSLSMIPLALLIGLPVVLFSAGVFALVAFVKPTRGAN